MKNFYSKTIGKLLFLKRNLTTMALKCLNSLNKDFYFYNNNTELLAIWTLLFLTITGLFILAIKSNILTVFLLFILAFIILSLCTFATIYYLHALTLNKNKLLIGIHNSLNKSFKFRSLFRFIRIPHFSIPDNIAKNFKFSS